MQKTTHRFPKKPFSFVFTFLTVVLLCLPNSSFSQLSSCEGYSIKAISGPNSGFALMPYVFDLMGERVSETVVLGPWQKKRVYWKFEPVPNKSNTYRICDSRKPQLGFICMRSMSRQKNIPTPILHLDPDGSPLEWRLELVDGRPNTYKVICVSPGDWSESKLVVSSMASQVFATLSKTSTHLWEIKNLTHITDQGSPVGTITKNEDIIGDVKIHWNGFTVSTYEKTENGKKLNVANNGNFMNRSVFTVKYYPNKGYTIAPVNNKNQVICTSRSDYSNNCDYKKPDRYLWLYEWMSGGNQYWNIFEENGKYLIQNTHSGLFIAYDHSQECLIQTTRNKAAEFSFSKYVDPNEPSTDPPPPARRYKSKPIPKQTHLCLMDFSELGNKTMGESKSAYGNGLNKKFGDYRWNMANEQQATVFITNFKNTHTPIPSGTYWVQNNFRSVEGQNHVIKPNDNGELQTYSNPSVEVLGVEKATVFFFREYDCLSIPNRDVSLMDPRQLADLSYLETKKRYGAGEYTLEGSIWTFVDDYDVYYIASNLKGIGEPLPAGMYWIEGSFSSGEGPATWVEIDENGDVKQYFKEDGDVAPSVARVLLTKDQ